MMRINAKVIWLIIRQTTTAEFLCTDTQSVYTTKGCTSGRRNWNQAEKCETLWALVSKELVAYR